MWTCKENIVGIYDYLDPDAMNMDLDMNTFNAWKKELVKKLKDWDKCYLKHQKSTYPEINKIHEAGMKPLVDLMKSNTNFK